eukprot:TRINITY_DN7636_c0_g1_i1.p1 TRINITY_DN7636_c0_g1~~TRINITY_DN7636_c0_g1_i1.p1  ORF type:complete len:139 (+),score=15.75 TRINITY_DN7636_c0_g1_i1:258-674(+)
MAESEGTEVFGLLINFLILLFGLFLEVFGIPLWVRKVAPNGWYSGTFFVRRSALRNTQQWYELNELAGKIMTISGFVTCVISLIMWFIPSFSHEVPVRIAVLLVCVIGSLGSWYFIISRKTNNERGTSTTAEAVFDSL